jgi:uncharacterized protein YciI
MPHHAIRTRVTWPALTNEGRNEHERAAFLRHSAWLKERGEDDTVGFAGRGPAGWAIAVLNADSEEEAGRVMNDDPFVPEGVVTPELFPLDVLYFEPQNR